MSRLKAMEEVIGELRRWGDPRIVTFHEGGNRFVLSCRLSESPVVAPPEGAPASLLDFWRITSSARLFYDVKYGQWGIDILDPESARIETETFRTERALDFMDGDLIIGRCRGDSELVLLRTDPDADDFGEVIIVDPLDRWRDWQAVAPDFVEFLRGLIEANGNKYWET
jgi:hypothetical protein